MKGYIKREKVKNAIQTALPFYVIGNENTPDRETMNMIKSARICLYEQLGFFDELDEELEVKNE